MTAVDAALSAGSVKRPRYAARRLYRLLSLSLGVTTVLLMVMLWPVIPVQAEITRPWFSTAAAVVVTIPAVVALALFWTARIHVLRMIWQIQSLGMLAIYAFLPLMLANGSIPAGPESLWLFEVEAVAGCAAVLAWSTRVLVGYVIVWQSIMLGIGFTGVGGVAGPVMGDVVRELVTVAMFTTLAAALLRAGDLLDTLVESAVEEAQATARAEVQRARRRTLEMLIHDRIIVALLAYATGASATRSAAEARAALHAIGRSEAVAVRTDRSPRDLAWQLQALTTRIDGKIRFDYAADGTTPIPATVVSALSEAMSEALRNSIRHASPHRAVSRQVHASVTSDEITVVILDNGTGFDIDTVGPARLGIRHGIIHRMTDLPGGIADIRCRIDYGTVVTLGWRRP